MTDRPGVDEHADKVLRVLAWEATTPEPESWGGERAGARDAVYSLLSELASLKDALGEALREPDEARYMEAHRQGFDDGYELGQLDSDASLKDALERAEDEIIALKLHPCAGGHLVTGASTGTDESLTAWGDTCVRCGASVDVAAARVSLGETE